MKEVTVTLNLGTARVIADTLADSLEAVDGLTNTEPFTHDKETVRKALRRFGQLLSGPVSGRHVLVDISEGL